MSLASPSCSKRATKCFLDLPLSLLIKDSNSFSSTLDPSISSMQSIKEGLVMMVVLMLGVTLLVSLAMRHLSMMFSLVESKRDTRGVVAMATEAIATESPPSSSSSSSLYSYCATNPLGGVLLVKLLLLGKDLALSSNELATIVFSLLIRTFHNKMAHIAIIIASPHALLDL